MDLLIVAFVIVIFLKDLVFSLPWGGGNYEILNSNTQRMNRFQGYQERETIITLANNKLQPKDAHAIIKGALDDLQIVQETGQNSDEADLLKEGHSPLDGIDLSSFIVQRLSKKTNSTNYYAFEDTPDAKPLFMRSAEDYGVDFIIFMDPAFPKGTGHYIVLRRLESHTDIMNYAADEEVEIHEGFQDKMYDFEDEDNEEEDDQRLGGGYEDYYTDPRRQYPKSEKSLLTEKMYDEVPGTEQSGEENDQNTAQASDDENNDSKKQLVSPYNETMFYGKSVPSARNSQGQTWKQKFTQEIQEDENGEIREVIYESFLVIFKGSIHGFISNIDPLQFSFQAEGDLAGTLNENEEDDDGGDKENTEGEDDDDDDSYNYGLNEASPDLFEDSAFYDFPDNEKRQSGFGGKRRKRSVKIWETKKEIRLGECLRRVGQTNVDAWKKLDLDTHNEQY